MAELTREAIIAARYPREYALRSALTQTAEVSAAIEKTKVLRSKNAIRAKMLSRAVRVSPATVPSVAASLTRLASIYGDRAVEAYIFADADINAFVSEGRAHTVIGFSSAAIEKLSPYELEFVLGHELGHALLDHNEIYCDAVISLAGDRHEDLVRAWQRAAELSADRAGLLCTPSLEVGLSALIKTVSGLNVGLNTANIREILAQWDTFAEEILNEGTRDTTLSHPFPLLRLRALALYSQHGNTPATNREADRMMAYMEPGDEFVTSGKPARPSQAIEVQAVDPYLTQFVFWGALYALGPDGHEHQEVRQHLTELHPPGLDTQHVLSNARAFATSAIAKLQEARAARREKISAQDTFEIISSVIQIAKNQHSDAAYQKRIAEIGTVFGISADAISKMHKKG
ncbi:MAG: M48 family metallopeptidase [Myxococcales bacterium]|nr:M48 family metallopeptidase [Myxococcales bacterium]